jgi:LmbE family N-acetylglucosaminyl deacetylase
MTDKLNLLVTAGHPADAFDAVGGTIAQHTDRGDRVTVAVMTHGVKSHSWHLMAQERTAKASATDADVQIQIEIKEQEIRDGLSILGVDGDQVHFMGIDDAFLNIEKKSSGAWPRSSARFGPISSSPSLPWNRTGWAISTPSAGR